MIHSEIKLPPNRNFGFFFTLIFLIIGGYFWYKSEILLGYCSGTIATLLFIITLINADILLPLNKLWMRFGLLIGMIISPLVIGLIFFGLITPIAYLLRFRGRDELRLKRQEQSTHWINRSTSLEAETFRLQF